MEEEDVRRQAVDALVARAGGVWDSFPDPEVGRILLPRLEGATMPKNTVDSNEYGLREESFAVPKPTGTTRIVLLGDSFVFGASVPKEERFGVFLAQMLRQRAKVKGAVEVLHVGMSSWNIRAEVSYLQRNISNFQPDLVVQVLVSNDLDDSGTVRGFGAVADFTPQRPGQTTSFRSTWSINGLKLGFRKLNHINHALSYESRRRFQEAAADLERLEGHLARSGIGYLVVLAWKDEPRIAGPHLLGDLAEEEITFLPRSHRLDRRFHVARSDPHWSPEGHERVARFLMGAIEERGLLPGLELEPWPEAVELFQTLHREGVEEADPRRLPDLADLVETLDSKVDMKNLNEQVARQVYGGVMGNGMVAPYAAILLGRGSGRRIRILGATLGRAELEGTRLAIFADEVLLTTVTLPRKGRLDLEFPLPKEILERPSFDVRFVADNFAYVGRDLRLCASFRLKSVEVLQ